MRKLFRKNKTVVAAPYTEWELKEELAVVSDYMKKDRSTLSEEFAQAVMMAEQRESERTARLLIMGIARKAKDEGQDVSKSMTSEELDLLAANGTAKLIYTALFEGIAWEDRLLLVAARAGNKVSAIKEMLPFIRDVNVAGPNGETTAHIALGGIPSDFDRPVRPDLFHVLCQSGLKKDPEVSFARTLASHAKGRSWSKVHIDLAHDLVDGGFPIDKKEGPKKMSPTDTAFDECTGASIAVGKVFLEAGVPLKQGYLSNAIPLATQDIGTCSVVMSLVKLYKENGALNIEKSKGLMEHILNTAEKSTEKFNLLEIAKVLNREGYNGTSDTEPHPVNPNDQKTLGSTHKVRQHSVIQS